MPRTDQNNNLNIFIKIKWITIDQHQIVFIYSKIKEEHIKKFQTREFFKMKSRFILLITILFIGSIPFTPISAASAVPAPEFISITPDGNTAGSLIFDVNETLTIQYKTDRLSVDGVILLGSGSNLTENINDARALNFTRVSSFQDKSTWEVEFDITSYTKFHAYAWSVDLVNGTYEEIDNFDGTDMHQLWIEKGLSFPVFSTVEDAELRSAEYYTPIGSQVTIVYTVDDPYDNATITLSFGDNRTEVYDGAKQFSMVKINRDTNNVTTFKYNYTTIQRIEFFAAFSDYGWERKLNSEDVHILTNGFSFEKAFDLDNINQYTDIDDITMNVTAYNQTVDDDLYLRYRVLENATSDVIIANWTEVSFGAAISSSLQNDTNNYNTTVDVYQQTITSDKFDTEQIVEVQAFVVFKTGTYNESAPVRIEIKDSRPTISIFSLNDSYYRGNSSVIEYSFSTVRGDIKNATLTANYTSSTNMLNFDNRTVSFLDNGEIVNGVHIATILVFNDLNRSSTENVFFNVDTISPEASFLDTSDSKTAKDGSVTVFFDFEDSELTGTGVKFAELDWGDGIAINVTELTNATHQYRKNVADGFDVTLKVIDMAGNVNTITFTIISDIDVNTSETSETPLNITFMMISLALTVFVLRRRK